MPPLALSYFKSKRLTHATTDTLAIKALSRDEPSLVRLWCKRDIKDYVHFGALTPAVPLSYIVTVYLCFLFHIRKFNNLKLLLWFDHKAITKAV